MNRRRFIKSGLIFVPTIVMPHDMVRSSGFLPIPTLNDETYRWAYSRVRAAGGVVTENVVMYNDALVTGLKQFGLRSKVKRLNTYCGTFAALSAPLIADTQIWPIDQAPASSDTLSGFVSGDYSESTGLTGGLNKYIDTGLKSNDTSYSWHMGAYIRTGSNVATHAMGSQTSGGADTVLIVSFSSTSYWDSYNFSGGRCSFSDSAGTGFYVGSRTNVTTSILYKNGVNSASTSGDGGTQGPNVTVGVHCIHDSVSGFISFNARTFALYTIGSGLSPTDASNYYTLVQKYQTAMGRQV